MSRPAENVRIRRTRTLLRDALVELIEERGFEKTTVGEICERAMVSRAAFYRNYRDKYHLVEQIFDEARAGLQVTVAASDPRPPLERWVGFLEHIDAYHRMYGALLGRRGSPWFAERMRISMAEIGIRHLQLPETARGLVPNVLGAMFVQSITWWLDNDRPTTPREIAIQTSALARAIMTEANSWAADAGESSESSL
ncbi:TetR/AcrR family transcriptional regulator [Actinomadura nitritigenes]|uniref:TetR/AcrR family transcriptional regulator n=1 Tax=Actinomadura nitritigenes TaxID=134602 RepID=UPI001FB59F8D|nr:TetR/AcrR family transcriptional regulator [Actinomadura nitritigenes]